MKKSNLNRASALLCTKLADAYLVAETVSRKASTDALVDGALPIIFHDLRFPQTQASSSLPATTQITNNFLRAKRRTVYWPSQPQSSVNLSSGAESNCAATSIPPNTFLPELHPCSLINNLLLFYLQQSTDSEASVHGVQLLTPFAGVRTRMRRMPIKSPGEVCKKIELSILEK